MSGERFFVAAVVAIAIAAAAEVGEASALARGTHGRLRRLFERLDRNHDGKISREEAAAAPFILRRFDAIDANKDGFLSYEELVLFLGGRRHEPGPVPTPGFEAEGGGG